MKEEDGRKSEEEKTKSWWEIRREDLQKSVYTNLVKYICRLDGGL